MRHAGLRGGPVPDHLRSCVLDFSLLLFCVFTPLSPLVQAGPDFLLHF